MSFKKAFFALLSFVVIGGALTGCGKTRIAVDEARGIKFSTDKRTLVKYNSKLPDKKYTVPNGVTAIGKEAFFGCDNLTSVTIPDSVTEIGEEAFFDCENLKSVTIPDSVTEIGKDAFAECPCEEAVKRQFPNYR